MEARKTILQFGGACLAVVVAFAVGGCGRPLPVVTEVEVEITNGVGVAMVKLPNGLYMGKYEVTQEQWGTVMATNPACFTGADRPVETVSWHDCQAFVAKLNELELVKASGLVFRLPTEGEWEYACRAETTGDFSRRADGVKVSRWNLGTVAWYGKNSGGETHLVGRKQPNAFGLCDMHGNVWEWMSTADDDGRVSRGGSWYFSASLCEAGYRYGYYPDFRCNYLGFRLAARQAAK